MSATIENRFREAFEAHSADAARQQVSGAIHWKLLDELHPSTLTLLRPAAEVALVAAMLWTRTGIVWVGAWAGALLLAIAGRAALCGVYRAGSDGVGSETWAWRFILTAWVEAALWGSISAAIPLVSDPVVHVIVVAALGSNLCAIVTTSSAEPRAAQGQVLLMMLPMAVCCLMTRQSVYLGYAVLVVLQIVMSLSRIGQLNRKTVGLLKANENVAITNLQLNRANQRLAAGATTDALTKLSNRLGFDNALRRELGRAVREYRPITVMLVALDHYDKLAEALGPEGADECLRRVADGLQLTLRRPTDIAACYGPGEFAVALPDTDSVAAHYLGERICAAIKTLGIAHPEAVSGFVTVSIGHASIVPDETATPLMLVRQADIALTRAKASGRHCSCGWDAALDATSLTEVERAALPALSAPIAAMA